MTLADLSAAWDLRTSTTVSELRQWPAPMVNTATVARATFTSPEGQAALGAVVLAGLLALGLAVMVDRPRRRQHP